MNCRKETYIAQLKTKGYVLPEKDKQARIEAIGGKNERYYFASNAALRMAVIYEKQRNLSKAKLYYNTALSMRGHDHEDSIKNKAKEGLKRIAN